MSVISKTKLLVQKMAVMFAAISCEAANFFVAVLLIKVRGLKTVRVQERVLAAASTSLRFCCPQYLGTVPSATMLIAYPKISYVKIVPVGLAGESADDAAVCVADKHAKASDILLGERSVIGLSLSDDKCLIRLIRLVCHLEIHKASNVKGSVTGFKKFAR